MESECCFIISSSSSSFSISSYPSLCAHNSQLNISSYYVRFYYYIFFNSDVRRDARVIIYTHRQQYVFLLNFLSLFWFGVFFPVCPYCVIECICIEFLFWAYFSSIFILLFLFLFFFISILLKFCDQLMISVSSRFQLVASFLRAHEATRQALQAYLASSPIADIYRPNLATCMHRLLQQEKKLSSTELFRHQGSPRAAITPALIRDALRGAPLLSPLDEIRVVVGLRFQTAPVSSLSVLGYNDIS